MSGDQNFDKRDPLRMVLSLFRHFTGMIAEFVDMVDKDDHLQTPLRSYIEIEGTPHTEDITKKLPLNGDRPYPHRFGGISDGAEFNRDDQS